ncbi:MAG: rhodanese-like domain-containing protein [Alphaproteobacteria bacterium]|jgi:rhodanese-related sulfurtransferase
MLGEGPITGIEEGVAPGDGYAGDVTPQQAWSIIEESGNAVLIDCRTQPEWAFVGVPDISTLGSKATFIPWQVFPAMQINAQFVDQVRAGGAEEDAPVLVICRSGSRSRSASVALTGAGFGRCYNIAGGFEGGLDGDKHRGGKDGWKAQGLPWIQG